MGKAQKMDARGAAVEEIPEEMSKDDSRSGEKSPSGIKMMTRAFPRAFDLLLFAPFSLRASRPTNPDAERVESGAAKKIP